MNVAGNLIRTHAHEKKVSEKESLTKWLGSNHMVVLE